MRARSERIERGRNRATEMIEARDYLQANFRGEVDDENVLLLDDFLPVVRNKQALSLAPRNVAMVAEAMEHGGISKQAMADALDVSPKTVQNWRAWHRPRRFSTPA